jgi:glyoxylase-like metal-dependent hydrolase (beta-lactamase superfamily II)
VPHYTLNYIVRDDDGGLHLIDPGWNTDENRQRLDAFLVTIAARPSDIVSVVATHLHADHLGLAGRLRDETGARVSILREEQAALHRVAEAARTPPEKALERFAAWGVGADEGADLLAATRSAAATDTHSTTVQADPHPDVFTADHLLDEGDVLDIPGRRMRVLHTPGHTPGHLSLVDDTERLILTGDHVLPSIYPGLGLGGPAVDPLGGYLTALEEVARFDDHEVLPGHGYRFTGLADRCAAIRRHHLTRSAEIARLLDEVPDATTYQIAERVTWTAGWPNLRGFYRVSALAQTAMHMEHLTSAGSLRKQVS